LENRIKKTRLTRRSLPILAAAALFALSLPAPAQVAPAERPKLVLLIAADQFRYDYLPRFRKEYTSGLKMLLDRGAVFANAHLEHYPTVTAIGHATMLSGATPALSGIIGNDWYDRETGKQVTSVSDGSTKTIGGSGGMGSSPHRLLVSTVGDELKRSGMAAKVIGVSLKDRSAILPAGRRADAAYWYDTKTGDFVSSTWYFDELPDWVQKWNAEKQADRFAGKSWMENRKLPDQPGAALYAATYSSSFGNDLLADFAIRAMEIEKLGQRDATDLLSVSFSSNDAVGHTHGPDSAEARAVSIATDRTLGRLFERVDQLVGLANTIIVFTADHGVGPRPEILQSERMPGGRLTNPEFFAPVKTALEQTFGSGQWLLSTAGSSPYFNYSLIEEKKIDPADVERIAARALYGEPHVARVYTRQQLLDGRAPADRFDARVIRSFHPQRSGDLEVLLDPYWIRGKTVATHGSPYLYDSHIPLIFAGPGIRPGRYLGAAALNDAAPTLAGILDIEIPSGSVGRVLTEMIASVPPASNVRPSASAASR
jgi:predicted AlkP superfamily pyrophosphatase or phosphodiesterase